MITISHYMICEIYTLGSSVLTAHNNSSKSSSRIALTLHQFLISRLFAICTHNFLQFPNSERNPFRRIPSKRKAVHLFKWLHSSCLTRFVPRNLPWQMRCEEPGTKKMSDIAQQLAEPKNKNLPSRCIYILIYERYIP